MGLEGARVRGFPTSNIGRALGFADFGLERAQPGPGTPGAHTPYGPPPLREKKQSLLLKRKTLLSQQAEQKPAAAGRASSPRCRAKAAAVLFAARASSREEQRAGHEEQPTGWIRQARARLLRAQRRFRRDVLRSDGSKRHDKQRATRARARSSLVWLLCSIPSRCYMC